MLDLIPEIKSYNLNHNFFFFFILIFVKKMSDYDFKLTFSGIFENKTSNTITFLFSIYLNKESGH